MISKFCEKDNNNLNFHSLLRGMRKFDFKFEFVSKLEKGKVFATKHCSIFFELQGKTLLIKGRYLDYNWDKNFKEAADLLYTMVCEEEIQPLNCSF